jgi:hypothetical protein
MTFPATDPDVIYDLARGQVDTQLAAVDGLDAKVSGFYAAGSTMLGIVAAIYAIRPQTFEWGGVVVLSLAVFVWALLAAACLIGVGSRKWQMGPKLDQVYDDYLNFGEREIKWRAVGTLLRLYKMNVPAYNTKTTIALWSPVLLAAESGLVVAAAVMVALHAAG